MGAWRTKLYTVYEIMEEYVNSVLKQFSSDEMELGSENPPPEICFGKYFGIRTPKLYANDMTYPISSNGTNSGIWSEINLCTPLASLGDIYIAGSIKFCINNQFNGTRTEEVIIYGIFNR